MVFRRILKVALIGMCLHVPTIGAPPSPAPRRVLLGDVVTHSAALQRLAKALVVVLRPAPDAAPATASTAAPSVTVAVDAEADAAAALAAVCESPVTIAATKRGSAGEMWSSSRDDRWSWGQIRTPSQAADIHLPRPRTALLLLNQAHTARRRLARLLPKLRETVLWSSDAPFVVTLRMRNNETSDLLHEAFDAQRPLAHSGAWRAMALGVESPSPTGERTHAWSLRLSPSRRPSRHRWPPAPVAAAATLPAPSLRGLRMVFAVFTEEKEAEQRCHQGNFNWGQGPNELLMQAMALGAGIIPVCYTKYHMGGFGRDPDGRPAGMGTRAISGIIDVIGCDDITSTEINDIADYFYPYQQPTMCLYVRTPRAKTFLQSVSSALDPVTWTLAAAALVALGAGQWVAARMDVTSLGFSKTLTMALDVLNTFVTGGVDERRGSQMARGFVTAISIYGLVFLNAFQGSFTSFLAVRRYERAPATIAEVTQSVRVVFAPVDSGKRLWVDGEQGVGDEKHMRDLVKLFHPAYNMGEWYAATSQVVNSEDKALLLSGTVARLTVFKKNFTTVDGFPLLHKVAQCPVSFVPYSFGLRKHSPFRATLQRAMSLLLQGGSWRQFWLQSGPTMMQRFGLLPPVRSKRHRRPPRLPPYALDAGNLSGAFAVWAVGLAAATMVFLLERLPVRSHSRDIKSKSESSVPWLKP